MKAIMIKASKPTASQEDKARRKKEIMDGPEIPEGTRANRGAAVLLQAAPPDDRQSMPEASRLLPAGVKLENDVRFLIAGNWKMNGSRAMLAELDRIAEAAAAVPKLDVAIAPPFTLLGEAKARAGMVAIGGQDCHPGENGAFTGSIAAGMLVEMGSRFVLCGHSERRAEFGETDILVNAKAVAAQSAGLTPYVCVGESEAGRNAGHATHLVADQLRGSVPRGSSGANLVVAYEPTWAIGTGRTPSTDEICEMHALIRATLTELLYDAGKAVRILYGGSVNPSNAATILACANVNGALVGGASLKAGDFLGIAAAYA
jgi:triosephosphate isomerase